MSKLTVFSGAQVLTMSSREVAELVDSRHDSVKRTIERCAEKEIFTLPPLVETSFKGADGRGQTASVYQLDKRASLIVVAQLCPEFTARIVDRWQQLEAQAADPARLLSDPATLRHVLLDYTERVIALQAQVGELTPKAAALDRIASHSDGSFCLTDAAKALQVPPRKFVAKLQQMGWIYRRPMGSGWLAYQDRITVGHMEHKVTTGDKSDGTEWTSTQVRITAKGMARLSVIFTNEPISVSE